MNRRSNSSADRVAHGIADCEPDGSAFGCADRGAEFGTDAADFGAHGGAHIGSDFGAHGGANTGTDFRAHGFANCEPDGSALDCADRSADFGTDAADFGAHNGAIRRANGEPDLDADRQRNFP